MMLEGDLKDTLWSGEKKDEAPFCNFAINVGVNVHQSKTDILWWISIDFLLLP